MPTKYWHRLDDGRTQCDLCPRACRLHEGQRGTCRREQISMCGRVPAAVALEAARQLGATTADTVDYRHSGLVTGEEQAVVAYAGVVVQ